MFIERGQNQGKEGYLHDSQIRSEILNQICKSIKEFKGNLLILLNRKPFNRSGLNKAEIALKADLT